ncbi:MAG TPA: SRPBCC family protein [bacterium]|nr:SRPBCC family protein [bacterium]
MATEVAPPAPGEPMADTRKRMSPWLKGVLGLVAFLGLFLVAGTAIGAGMDPTHETSTAITLQQPPETLWADLTAVDAYPQWRPEVRAIKRHPGTALKWDEDWGGGQPPVTLTAITMEAPRHLVLSIDDNEGTYSGSWDFTLEPAGSGTRITITERGTINNSFLRFAMCGLMKCTDYCLKVYLRDLAQKYGETARFE